MIKAHSRTWFSTVKPKSYGDKTQMFFVSEAYVALFPMSLLNFQIADTCTHCVLIFLWFLRYLQTAFVSRVLGVIFSNRCFVFLLFAFCVQFLYFLVACLLDFQYERSPPVAPAIVFEIFMVENVPFSRSVAVTKNRKET